MNSVPDHHCHKHDQNIRILHAVLWQDLIRMMFGYYLMQMTYMDAPTLSSNLVIRWVSSYLLFGYSH